jgi:hypothetical protein
MSPFAVQSLGIQRRDGHGSGQERGERAIEIGADESAVHSFDDNGLAFDLVRFSNSNFTLS